MNEVLQVAFQNAPDPKEQWIQLFPEGTFYGEDGRGPYVMKNPHAVIARSIRAKTDLSIDRDHQFLLSAPGTVIPAAGWIKEFQVRGEQIWARVEWTDYAAYQLTAKEYRYFSPEFVHDKTTGEILKIKGGSLTNKPNFELAAVASQQPHIKEQKMDEHLKKLISVLGLAATVTTEQLVAAAIARMEKADKLEADFAAIRKSAGLDDKATTADITKKAEELVAASQKKPETGTKNPDPSEFVPMKTFQETASQLKTLQDDLKKERAETAVAAAMKDGKITPAQKVWALSYATSEPEKFKEYLGNAPVIATASASATGQTADGQASKLTAEEAHVASQLGLSEDQFLGKKDEGKKAA